MTGDTLDGFLTAEEARLVRRLRQLRAGVYMVIIQKDGVGLLNMSVQGGAKIEKLKKQDVATENNAAGES